MLTIAPSASRAGVKASANPAVSSALRLRASASARSEAALGRLVLPCSRSRIEATLSPAARASAPCVSERDSRSWRSLGPNMPSWRTPASVKTPSLANHHEILSGRAASGLQDRRTCEDRTEVMRCR